MLFVSTGDALIMAARFLASTVACRIVLMYEISGARQSVEFQDDGDYVALPVVIDSSETSAGQSLREPCYRERDNYGIY